MESGKTAVSEDNLLPDDETGNEQFPVEPGFHPVNRTARAVYDFLASARLAMVLLVVILVCCVTGATVWREAEAGRKIFATLWFNGILVLLVLNVACCFFGRIWGRRVTIVSFGMILFHLSFVALFLGIVFNSLFYFRGIIRLTEGETLNNSDPASYDTYDRGAFFDFSRLRGTTTLVKMHTRYKVDGKDKQIAYEVAVGEGANVRQSMVYVTKKLEFQGVDYFREKDGYSPLVALSDRYGKELYAAFLPLQSIKQKDNSYLYTTGTRDKPALAPFPHPPEQPVMGMQLVYLPSKLAERGGEALFKLYPLDSKGMPLLDKPFAEGKTAVGEQLDAGEYRLSVKEIRYWAAMMTRYEPGKPFILSSLWVGLAGMIITTAGRMLKSRRRNTL